MKRAIIIVIDSMGVGAMPDHKNYNDVAECNTLGNVARFVNGLNIPNLQKMGLGNIIEVTGAKSIEQPIAQFGKMKEKSKGKDTTTGHWEIAGLILDEPFKTYPNGFPQELINKFIEKTNCGGILANRPASGTAIIEELHEEHKKTKYPIIYTSADSVFQIAVDIDTISLETLYKWCQIARELLNGDYNTSRVIARPYQIIDGKPTRISKYRRDYSVEPPKPTLLNDIENSGGRVYGIGKIEDIFVKSGVTDAIHTGSNKEGLNLTVEAIKNIPTKKELIFTNLVDTDMLYGHRNDANGYARAIEEIDTYMPEILNSMADNDLLIITADHGCDPTVKGTDHTREYVPLLIYSKNIAPCNLGLIDGFDYISNRVKEWLEI